MRFRSAFAVILPVLAIACSQSTAAPGSKPDLTVEEQAIREMDARWLKAAQARDPAGEAAMFASDGVAYRERRSAGRPRGVPGMGYKGLRG
jgi:hypothetical protein